MQVPDRSRCWRAARLSRSLSVSFDLLLFL